MHENSKIECGSEFWAEELTEHLSECGRFIVPLSTSKRVSRRSHSKCAELLSPLTDCATDRCRAERNLPLQCIPANLVLNCAVTSRTKRSRNKCGEETVNSVKKQKTMQMPRQVSNSKFYTLHETMRSNKMLEKKYPEDLDDICEFEGETKVPELGEREGLVRRPRITLKGWTHSSSAVGFRLI
eukprot:TRINITY_DN2259_c0_g2_i1.p1 TRINITY_DN2259_c0_g2~~TRINITY_DN2259_c0_g2_i1.p1  ORF type:complete len:184 (-),score=37.31 TRINITY_DN2259_c0_g2_i1:36-587(-)